jgi:hypothetical protein
MNPKLTRSELTAYRALARAAARLRKAQRAAEARRKREQQHESEPKGGKR